MSRDTCRQRRRMKWRDVAGLRSTCLAPARDTDCQRRCVMWRDVARLCLTCLATARDTLSPVCVIKTCDVASMSREISRNRTTSPDVATYISRTMSPDMSSVISPLGLTCRRHMSRNICPLVVSPVSPLSYILL